MDSEWGEEQLAKMTPALREVAQKEAIRQMPVLCLNIRDHSECLRAVARYLPRKHWPRTWFHCSNSCKKATTANMGGRDIAAALQDTLKFVASRGLHLECMVAVGRPGMCKIASTCLLVGK